MCVCDDVDWPCTAYLQDGPGELASPRWPLHYPANLHCTWRISAPAQHRVRLDLTEFKLDRHQLGHCTEHVDHVRLLDGGTLTGRLIGFYCGHRPAFTVMSTGRDVMVQLVSDRHTSYRQYNETVVHRGFHAVFSFHQHNSTDDIHVDSSRYVDIGDGQSPDWDADPSYIDDSQGNHRFCFSF